MVVFKQLSVRMGFIMSRSKLILDHIVCSSITFFLYYITKNLTCQYIKIHLLLFKSCIHFYIMNYLQFIIFSVTHLGCACLPPSFSLSPHFFYILSISIVVLYLPYSAFSLLILVIFFMTFLKYNKIYQSFS